MKKNTLESYPDILFKIALNNIMRMEAYQQAPPAKKHVMLMKEYDKLYREDRKQKL